MKRVPLAQAAIILVALSGGAASAQLSALKGAGGLFGSGGVPSVASTSAGNAAGLLTYCLKNKLLGGQDSAAVLGKLTGTQGVASSKDYALGAQGQLQTGEGTTLPLGDLKGRAKTAICDMVLKHGKTLAGF